MARTHPKDAAAKSVIEIQEVFVEQLGTDQGSQSNQVYKLTAEKGRALGGNGETVAFAKPMVTAREFKNDRNLSITTSYLFEDQDSGREPQKLDERGQPLKDERGKPIKPGILKDESGNPIRPGLLQFPESGGDRGMLTRQVASYQADKLLKLNAVSEEKFGRNPDGSVCGVSLQAEGAAVIGKTGVLNVDLSRPEIQRGLSDLEVSDFITGQADRHPANIFIDPVTGKVTGIDNDMSLPEVSREEILKRGVDFNGKMVTGMPRRMHQETAAKILAADPEELRATLSQPPPQGGPQPLSKKAIDGAVNRLIALQTELQKPNSPIQVLAQFNKNTYDQTIQEQKQMFNQSPDALQVGVNWDNIPELDASTLDTCPKNSYIGALAIANHKNGLAPVDLRLPVVDYTGESSRLKDYDHDLYSKIAEAYPKMTPTQQKALDKDFLKLGKLQDQLAEKEKHMVKPGLTDRLKALGEGMDKVKQNKQQHIDDLKKDIAVLKSQMNTATETVLGPSNTAKVQNTAPKTKPPVPDRQTQPKAGKVDQGLELSEKEASQLLQSLNKLSSEPKQASLSLSEQEAGELLKSLNKLSNQPKESRRDSLKLNDQEAQELLKALNDLSPEKLQQAQKKSQTIGVTDEQLDQMIKELKAMDLEQPTESVASKLNLKHVGSGTSQQKQKVGEPRKLRDDVPELVHNQGQKQQGPKAGTLKI